MKNIGVAVRGLVGVGKNSSCYYTEAAVGWHSVWDLYVECDGIGMSLSGRMVGTLFAIWTTLKAIHESRAGRFAARRLRTYMPWFSDLRDAIEAASR
jgi:hypothetical protein